VLTAWLAVPVSLGGVLVRRFRDTPALRFGLPTEEPNWTRLGRALSACAPIIAS